MSLMSITAQKKAGTMFAFLVLTGSLVVAGGDLESGFRKPPESAKPQTYWWWMNGNVTKEGITADLEAMKRVGLGGALIMEADNGGILPGPVKFMSQEWWQLTRHAIAEAHRLGLEMNITNCGGWAGAGGPWVTPEQGGQIVATSELSVQGPTHFSAVLARPTVNRDYYRDIAVLAFPTPRGETDSMKAFSPKITDSSADFDAEKVLDGDPKTLAALPLPPEPEKPYVQMEFAEPFSARTLTVSGIIPDFWPCEVQISEDGQTFKTLNYYSLSGRMQVNHLGLASGTEAVKSRFYRLVFPRHPGIQLAEVNLSQRLSVGNFDKKTAYLGTCGIYTAPEQRGARADSVADSAGQTASGFVVPRQAMVDLTSHLASDGRLDWDVPPGQWTILRLGHTAAGCLNHQGPAGSNGLECDKLSNVGAEAHWAGMMQKVVDAAGPLAGKTLKTVHIDSWENGSQNWTAAFPEEFLRLRGYDMRPFLPVLSNRIVESPEITERFLWDMRRTIGELFVEKFYRHFADLAHRRGLKLQAQTYGGGSLDELLSSGSPDIPMAEFWPGLYGGNGEPSLKLASSAAHTHCRPIVSAESYSCNSKPQFHPFVLKRYGDLSYGKGINRFVFCCPAHQPWTDLAPGMTTGAWGFHFDRNVTWWNQSKAWLSYLARCQFLLQEGTFAADICFFGGEDYLAGYQRGGESLWMGAKAPLPPGYDYDLCDRRILLDGMTFENGVFVLPSGMRYRFLVLPDSKALTLPVVKKVRDLVAAGGTVIGPKPVYSPTLENYPECETEIRKIADEVWGACDGRAVTENRFGKGRVIWGQSYADVFAASKLPPDFSFKSSSTGNTLNAIHRTSKNADWYFVANLEMKSLEAVCAFRVTGKRPEFWHPDTGKMEPAAWYRIENGQTFVPMRLDPSGSVFVVFRSPAGDSIVSVAHDGQPIIYDQPAANASSVEFQLAATKDGATLNSSTPGRYEFVTAAVKKMEATVAVPPPQPIEGPWDVTFDSKWFYPDATGGKVQFEQLSDWSRRPEDAIKYFSGTAVYEKPFNLSESLTSRPGSRLSLDLGAVEVIAEVEVNGKNLGILWKPPFSVDITDAVKRGQNTLRVRVTNLWPNRQIGDEHLPADCEYLPAGGLKAWPEWLTKNTPRTSGRRTFATWRFWKAEDPLLPSGLLGPVRLVTARVTTIAGK